MSKKKNLTIGERTAETARKIRGNWGNITPITKIIPNKKKDYEYSDDYDYENDIDLDDWSEY